MKNILLIIFLFIFFGCASNQNADTGTVIKNEDSNSDKKRELAQKEEAGVWEILFDGTNTDKWIGVGSDKFPENAWVIENNALVLGEGGNIITKEKYGDFDLEFEFNMTPAANSGVKYYVSKLENKESGKSVTNGPEYQIIDDFNNPDIKDRTDETVTTAALYLFYPPINKKLLPAGQWNQARIISKDQHVEHWLNGIKVLSYERGSEDFRERKAATKFKNYEMYGEVPSGHILLTDHIDKVYFRNIRIKRL